MALYYNILKLSIFLKILTEGTAISSCDYPPCSDGAEHSMCKYPASLDRTAPKCSSKAANSGLNNEYRKAILDAHNLLRQRVAQEKQPGQPGAANMMKLAWHSELEAIAQRFVNECGKDGLYHDQCRDLVDGTPVGQNSVKAFLSHKEGANRTQLFYNMVQKWYDEVSKFLKIQRIFNYLENNDTANYTQLVWAETDRLGCGYVEENMDKNGLIPVSMKCNYAVAGNVPETQVYIRGEACSECEPDARCSKVYPGLCTAEMDESEDGIGDRSTSLMKTNTVTYSIMMSIISILLCF